MNKLYMKAALVCALLGTHLVSYAGVNPRVKPEKLVDGNKYILVNKAQNSSQYMSRTSWDGALYFLGEQDSNYSNYALTAVKNDDGTWSFTLPGTRDVETGEYDEEGNPIMQKVDAPYYMWIPAGTDNVNLNTQDDVAKWILKDSEKFPGFYQIEVGEGNGNDNCIGLNIHLNAGAQYVIASESSNSWYPDFAGGVDRDYDEMTGDEHITVRDSTSFNWGFVSVNNLALYMQDMKIVKSISDFEEVYLDIDDYAEGFKVTDDAIIKLYNQEDYDEVIAEQIVSMIAAKIALYNEIEVAIGLNENDDAVLASAINQALSAFNTTTDAADLETIKNTLHQAEISYSMGNGDVTALGVNMSFEDLSAQGGTPTSGVAGVPAGWNITINGTTVTTADEVRAAGVTAWHGVNADCSGDIKDGNYGFGIWTQGIPTYEISQTISGLDNGTYIVSAGLMVGANGNGSRRTTQRIFANLSSTYYGSSDEYDASQLDNSEVYGFADLVEDVTDSEMQPIQVCAYVYDGTLTFGVRTDGNIAAANRVSSNPSSGDGWFKTDNFTIQKVGYDAGDAVAVFNHYYDILNDYYVIGKPMAKVVANTLDAQISTMGGVSENSSQEEINTAILGAKSLLATVNESVKVYEKLLTAIEQHTENLNTYGNKQGAGDYADIIYTAQDAYDDRIPEDEAAVDSIIAVLDNALQECKQSDAIEEGMSLTEYILNPSFEDLSAQNNSNTSGVVATPKGWDLYLDGTKVVTAADINAAGVNAWCGINEGDAINVTLDDGEVVTNQYSDGNHLWGIWNDRIPEVELSQVIKGLPAGQYTLTCDVLIQYNWAGNCLTTQRIFANDYVAMYSDEYSYENNLPEDAKIAQEIDAMSPDAELKHLVYAGYFCEAPRSDYSHTVSLTFGLSKPGEAKIGFRTNNITSDGEAKNSGLGWFKLDNWTLTYDSATVPEGADINADATAIESVDGNSQKLSVGFYTLGGVRLSSPQSGVNIVKMSDGSVSKVYVK